MSEIFRIPQSSFDFFSIFNNHNPIDLEIGMGRSHFLFDRAFKYPDRNIIGIEWKYEFVNQAQKRIARDDVKNALAFHGNAWSLVPLLFDLESIAAVFINFPDPWWKKRHKKRLLLNQAFLSVLHARMKKDGAIFFQTDVAELFSHYVELINASRLFLVENYSDETFENLVNAQSHREKKCLEQGLKLYRGIFLRK